VQSQALDTVKADFVRIALMDQDCFAGDKGTEALISLLTIDKGEHYPSQRNILYQRVDLEILVTDTSDTLRRKWNGSAVTSMAKWQDIMAHGAKLKAGSNSVAYVSASGISIR
jgi:hypothetical protein